MYRKNFHKYEKSVENIWKRWGNFRGDFLFFPRTEIYPLFPDGAISFIVLLLSSQIIAHSTRWYVKSALACLLVKQLLVEFFLALIMLVIFVLSTYLHFKKVPRYKPPLGAGVILFLEGIRNLIYFFQKYKLSEFNHIWGVDSFFDNWSQTAE